MSEGRRPVLARTVAFHGPVGCGKTSLIGLLAGVEDALVGEVEHRTGRTLRPHEVVAGDLGLLDLPGTVAPEVVAATAAAGGQVLCVAADEGVTDAVREHAALLAALGTSAGVVCCTRADLARDGTPAAFDMPGVVVDPGVVVCSARDGVSLDDLVAALGGGARRTRALDAAAPAVLHIEAVEEVPGAGTVVTGGLLRGALRAGDAVHVMPAWREGAVGALRVRGARVEAALAGDRVVVRLDGVGAADVASGDAVVGPDSGVRRTGVLDVSMGDRVRLPHGETVEVYAGARMTRAEVGWLGGRFHQLRCEDELLVAAWDRVVVRSPDEGLVGGDVLDPGARRHGPSRDVLAELTRRARGED